MSINFQTLHCAPTRVQLPLGKEQTARRSSYTHIWLVYAVHTLFDNGYTMAGLYQGGAVPGGSDTIAIPPSSALPCVTSSIPTESVWSLS